MSKALFVIGVVVTTLFVSSANAATLAELRQKNIVRMGFANEAPFSFTQPDGAVVGVDTEVMREVFRALGIAKIDGVLTQFGSLIPGLKANRFDVIGTGLYIRPDRCKQVLFSEPTLVVGSAIIVRAGNPKKFHAYADIAADPNLKLGYVVGGTMTTPEADGVKQEQFVSFTDVITAISALKAGRVDAVTRTFIDAERVVRESGDKAIELAKPLRLPKKDGKTMVNYIGFAFNTEDTELVNAVNSELKKFLGSEKHLAILDKYGITLQDYPVQLTTEQVCGG